MNATKSAQILKMTHEEVTNFLETKKDIKDFDEYFKIYSFLMKKDIELHWCIPAGSLCCCIIVAIWSLLKLHGQG